MNAVLTEQGQIDTLIKGENSEAGKYILRRNRYQMMWLKLTRPGLLSNQLDKIL